ncbi:MAG: 50S ribosomal protein L19 [Kofleriaceae bacterium]|nr:MAG: 50S ribosomal protein L19 [Kofleriaceae bacterium]MBZ0238052.1 50S ribosomal protein L19 [Kofleriaceae bacterium]
MSAHKILDSIDKQSRRQASLPEFRPGDSIKVWAKIREGEKTRLQAFEGVCIRRSRKGARSTFTVRKISYGVGVERIFPDNSPNIDRVEVLARGKVHQSRLFYLRDLQGKAARIKERGQQLEAAEPETAAEGASADEAGAAPAEAKEKLKGRGKRKKKKEGAAAAVAE